MELYDKTPYQKIYSVRRQIVMKIALEVLQRALNDIMPFNQYYRHITKLRNKAKANLIFSKRMIHHHHDAINWLRTKANGTLWFEILDLQFSKKVVERIINRRLAGRQMEILEIFTEAQ